MDAFAVLGSVAALGATGFAAVSAWLSRQATELLREEVALSRELARMDHAQRFESDLSAIYESLRDQLGAVDLDTDQIEPSLRGTVYRLVVLHSLAFSSRDAGVLTTDAWDPIDRECLYWLNRPDGRRVWRAAFAHQAAFWPHGYVDHVNKGLDGGS